MVNTERIIGVVVAFALAAAVVSSCSPISNPGASEAARDMLGSDMALQQPAGPQLQSTPLPESSVPTAPASASPKPCAEVNLIASKDLMSEAPFPEPKRFREFSDQGAANVVAYYTYAAYYGFISRKTATMRRVFTPECSKCVAMADWVESFVSQNARVQTGIPVTDIVDVFSEKTKERSVYWVVAQNREPAIVGCDAKGVSGGYDAPSTTKSLYRVESVDGENKITGIFQVPERYR